MSITVANLIAQLGMDLSQFRLGMREANTLQDAAIARANQASAHIAQLQNRARIAAADSSRYAAMAAAIPVEAYHATGTKLIQEASLISAKIAEVRVKSDAKMVALLEQFNIDTFAGNQQFIANDKKLIVELSKNTEAMVAKYEARDKAITAQVNKLVVTEANARARRASLEARSVSTEVMAGELGQRAGTYKESADAMLAYQVARGERMAQTSSEHITRLYNTVFSKMMLVGAATEAILVGITLKGADFNHMLKEAVNNTSLAGGEIAKFKDEIVKMGVETGLPFDKLAAGFRDIENYGFKLPEIIKIANASKKAALATGTDFAVMSDLIAGTMKNYKISADNADIAANVFYVIAKNAKGQMQDHVTTFGRLTMAARNHGQSMIDLGASYIVLSQHQESANRASTGLIAMLNKLANPTRGVIKVLNEFDKQAGNTNREFRRLFSEQGVDQGAFVFLSKLNGLIERLKSRQPGASTQSVMNQLLPFSRGGTEISTIVRELNDFTAMQAKVRREVTNTREITARYNEMLKDNQVQIDRAKNSMIVLAGSVAEALTPQIKYVTGLITGWTKSWNDLGKEQQQWYIRAVETVAGALIIISVFGKLAVGIFEVKKALIGLNIGVMLLGWKGAIAGFATEAIVAFGSVEAAVIALSVTLGVVTLGITALVAGIVLFAQKAEEANRKRGTINPSTGKQFTQQEYRRTQISSAAVSPQEFYSRNSLRTPMPMPVEFVRPLERAKEFEKTLRAIDAEMNKLREHALDFDSKEGQRYNKLVKDRDALRMAAAKAKIMLPADLGGNLDELFGNKPLEEMNKAQQAWQDKMDAMGKAPKKQKQVHDAMLHQANEFIERLRREYESLNEDSTLQGTFNRLAVINKRFDPHHQEVAQSIIDQINKTKELNQLNEDSATVFDQLNRMEIEGIKSLGEWYDLQAKINGLSQRHLSIVVIKNGLDRSNLEIQRLQNIEHEKTDRHIQRLMNQAKKGDEGQTVFSQWMDKLSTDTAFRGAEGAFAQITIAAQAQKTADYKQSLKDAAEAEKQWFKDSEEEWKNYEEQLKAAAKIVNDSVQDIVDYYNKLDAVQQKMADRATERTRPDLANANKLVREAMDTPHFKSLSPAVQATEVTRLKGLGLTDWFNEQLEKTKELTQGYYELGGGVRFTTQTWKSMSKELKDTFIQAAKSVEILTEMRDFATGIGDVFINMLNDVRQNGFRNFFTDILRSFDDMLFQLAAKWAQSQIVNMLLNVVGGLVGSFSGGSSGFGTTAAQQSSVFGLAGGGSIAMGRSYLVGERGPEIFRADRGGTIIPNGRSIDNGNGSLHVHNHITIMANDPNSFRQSKSQIMADIANVTQRAARRNG